MQEEERVCAKGKVEAGARGDGRGGRAGADAREESKVDYGLEVSEARVDNRARREPIRREITRRSEGTYSDKDRQSSCERYARI